VVEVDAAASDPEADDDEVLGAVERYFEAK